MPLRSFLVLRQWRSNKAPSIQDYFELWVELLSDNCRLPATLPGLLFASRSFCKSTVKPLIKQCPMKCWRFVCLDSVTTVIVVKQRDMRTPAMGQLSSVMNTNCDNAWSRFVYSNFELCLSAILPGEKVKQRTCFRLDQFFFSLVSSV